MDLSPAAAFHWQCEQPHLPQTAPGLQLNATATKVEVYYSKAVNYTLMITTLTFIQASRPAPLHRLPSCHLGNTCFPFREPLCQQP